PQVHARTEGVARAGEQDGAHAGVGTAAADGGQEVVAHLHREGVLGLGPVERDHGDVVAAHLDPDHGPTLGGDISAPLWAFTATQAGYISAPLWAFTATQAEYFAVVGVHGHAGRVLRRRGDLHRHTRKSVTNRPCHDMTYLVT